MAAFLKNLLGASETLGETGLQELLSRVGAERSALERLVERAEAAVTGLNHLAGTTDRLHAIETQLASLESVVPKLSAAGQRLTQLTESEQRLAGQLEHSSAELLRVRAELDVLGNLVDSAAALKADLSGFLALEEPFGALRREQVELESTLEATRSNFTKMRELEDRLHSEQEEATARLEAFEGQRQVFAQRLSEAEMRAAGVEQLLADLSPVTESVAESKRQLALVKVVADQVGQKVSLLEQQRDAVERTANRLEQLDGLAQRVEATLERQATQAQRVGEAVAAVDGLAAAQRGLSERSDVLSGQVQELETGMGLLRRELNGLSEATERATQRFELDRGSLEAVSQRLTDLRRGLSDAEGGLAMAAESRQMVDHLGVRVEALTRETATATAALQEASDLASRARAGAADLARLDRQAAGLQERVDRLEATRPALDAAVQDLAVLRGSHEAVRDALEQVRGADAELGGLRASLHANEGWLKETEQKVDVLRQEVAGLQWMRGTVESQRQEIDQVTAALADIETRRGTVDEVQRRLADASAVGAAIEERARGLQDRVKAAEDRAGALFPRLDELGRVGNQLTDLTLQLRETEERVESVRSGVTAVEARANNLDALEERVRVLARETDQRQGALEQAAAQLKQASILRQEAAEAVHALDERSRQVNEALERAAEKLGRVDELWTSLDGRMGNLRSVEERLNTFERRLREWGGTEERLALAQEQVVARQATLATLQEEIRGVYQLAERTIRDAQIIAESQPRIQQTRLELDALMVRLREVDAGTTSFEERRRQVMQAEERLAYAEAILMDLQGTVQSLVVQKAEADHLLEKTAALAMQSKQAEALIDTLREERRVNERIRVALSDAGMVDRKGEVGASRSRAVG